MPFGLSILPFIMVVTTYFQTKQTMVDPNQKMMIYIMPGMMFLFSNIMPSGLLIYWIISNLFSIVMFAWAKRDQKDVTPAVANVGGKSAVHPLNSKAKKNKKK